MTRPVLEIPTSAATNRIFLACAAAYNVGALSGFLQPIIINDYIVLRKLDPDWAGFLASIEMMSVAIAMLVMSRRFDRIPFLPAILAGFTVVMVATAASLAAEQFWLLLLLRVVCALGFAVLIVVPTMAVAALPQSQIYYGRLYTINLACSSALLLLLPWFEPLLGAPMGFKIALPYALMMLPLLLLMPRGLAPAAAARPAAKKMVTTANRAVYYLAAGIAVLSVVYSAFWAFFMVLAATAGLSASAATTVASFAILAAMAGSWLSAPLGRILGQTPLMLAGTLLLGGSLTLGTLASAQTPFVIGAVATLFTFYSIFPSALGMAADADASGKGAALVNACFVMFAATGPYLAGLVFNVGGMKTMAAITLAAAATAMVLFLRLRQLRGDDL